MSTHRYYSRSDLFLVRVWSEEAVDGNGKLEWHGKVQRVIDGESHQFREWQDLSTVLLAMLSNNKGATSADPIRE